MAYDPVRRRVVLFSGLGGGQAIDEMGTWEWDGTSWTKIPTTVRPAPRFRAAFAFDPVRRRTVLSHGESGGESLADTWEWDGVTWTQIVSPQAPAGRGSTAAAWNGSRRTFTLFAGSAQVFSQFEDTWELAAGAWTQQFTPARPGVRQGHTLTPLADGSGVMTFGGLINNGTGSPELWRLRWVNSSTYETCAVDDDGDGDGLAGCADPDCWTRCTPMCPPGTTCDPSWPHCGDDMCNTPLEDCRLCPSDCPCTPVCGDSFCDPGETCPGDC
ncbi:MAG: hypothetical protein IPQ07_38240 [Myxococcales bacterium]|nr:hypothetical protein [Myxococcales bacterium]